jgi:hypothetical protein
MDSSGSGWASFFENGNEIPGSVKAMGISWLIEPLTVSHKDSAPRGSLVRKRHGGGSACIREVSGSNLTTVSGCSDGVSWLLSLH